MPLNKRKKKEKSFSNVAYLRLIFPIQVFRYILKCWVLSKEASSTIFWVFDMTRPGIEPWFTEPEDIYTIFWVFDMTQPGIEPWFTGLVYISTITLCILLTVIGVGSLSF